MMRMITDAIRANCGSMSSPPALALSIPSQKALHLSDHLRIVAGFATMTGAGVAA